MTEQRRSYAGECVYVGVDVHKETYTVPCVCHKQLVKTATVQAEPASLAASVRRWFPGATLASAYEAGFSAFVLHRALTQAGISNIVVNPASLAVAANAKVKTDRRDSKRLAVDLADGRLRGIYVPTEEEELARLLPRTRAQLVEHRATLARQSKATLHQFGLIAPSRPGIGEVVARPVATALGDMTRFANERALCSDTGLTPSAYASGAAGRRGPLSRQGSSRGRHLLIETAWRAFPYDAVLQTMFERIAATRGKKRAIVAIARRLIGRIRACFRQGTMYAVGTLT